VPHSEPGRVCEAHVSYLVRGRVLVMRRRSRERVPTIGSTSLDAVGRQQISHFSKSPTSATLAFEVTILRSGGGLAASPPFGYTLETAGVSAGGARAGARPRPPVSE
jgi:hypothetical protein